MTGSFLGHDLPMTQHWLQKKNVRMFPQLRSVTTGRVKTTQRVQSHWVDTGSDGEVYLVGDKLLDPSTTWGTVRGHLKL